MIMILSVIMLECCKIDNYERGDRRGVRWTESDFFFTRLLRRNGKWHEEIKRDTTKITRKAMRKQTGKWRKRKLRKKMKGMNN